MLSVENPAELARHVGQKLGTSDWLAVDQAMIDAFAEVTGDNHWIHVDVERCKREMPGGKPIAHGYLTLSLIPRLSKTVYRMQGSRRAFNYGSNRVRFTAPVQAGARVRLVQTLKEAQPTDGGTRFTFESLVEIEGGARPAMIAETVVLMPDD